MDESRMISLFSQFRGRLRDDIVNDAIEYVGFNEPVHAVEMFCDHLFDHDVPITPDEFEELAAIAQELDADLERVEYLIHLVR